MTEDRTKYLSPAGVRAMLRIGHEIHRNGNLKIIPPEILAKRREIERATRNLELFISMIGAVDNGMFYRIVDMKHELDRMYGEWLESEAA